VPRLLPILRLLRIGTVFSPIADVVAGAAVAGLPFETAVARAAAASGLLYAAGMVWNDVADRRLDAEQRPERPLPRGDVSLPFACGLGSVLLLLAVWLSPCRHYHGMLAVLVLAYDFAGKRVAWLGVLGMACLRGSNLAMALAIAAATDVTLAPDRARDLVIAALCYGAYIAAVTILGIFEDEPSVAPRAVSAVQTAPPIVAMVGIVTVQDGFWPAPAFALLPLLVFLRRNARRRTWDQAAIRRSMGWLLLGTMLYTALLAWAAGQPFVAAAIAAAILPARRIARVIALT